MSVVSWTSPQLTAQCSAVSATAGESRTPAEFHPSRASRPSACAYGMDLCVCLRTSVQYRFCLSIRGELARSLPRSRRLSSLLTLPVCLPLRRGPGQRGRRQYTQERGGEGGGRGERGWATLFRHPNVRVVQLSGPVAVALTPGPSGTPT